VLVRASLRDWYGREQATLLWRETRDPYAILVSEVMLQQYGVENVEPPAVQRFSGLNRLFARHQEHADLVARGLQLFARPFARRRDRLLRRTPLNRLVTSKG
jgi:A/G-specific adenine glycosylase